MDVENVDVEDDDTGYDLSHSSKEKVSSCSYRDWRET